MKRSMLFLVFLVLISMSFATINTIVFPNNANDVKVSKMRQDGLRLDWSVKELNITEKTDDKGTFTHIAIEGFVGNNQVGLPELPYMGRFITVPLNAELSVNLINSNSQTISLEEYGINSVIYPAQPSYSKCTDMSTVDFIFNEESYKVSNYERNYGPFNFVEAGFLRGHRVFEVSYTPVQYNPVENSITVYDMLSVEIDFIGSNHSLTDYERARTWSPDFESVYKYFFLNYETPANRSDLIRYPTSYIIITYADFVNAMQPFADWKREQGYNVIMASTADIGNTTTSIKAYLQGLWDSATPENPAPSYVLFVGDVAQIPAWNAQSSPSDHITDLTYLRLQGTDFFPEMYYGRFSANNINELTPQIEKTLMYQKYEMPDPTYLERAVLIAGIDSNFGTSHANGQINYTSNLYFNPENGYPDPHIYLYPASGSNANNIINDVSQGAGWVNYTAHGYDQEWSNPNFDNSDVYSLQNYGMYPVVIGNCCLTNKFQVNQCFGEAWLRAPGKGGVIYIGGTNSTYWNEDYWWAVGYVTPPSNGAAVNYDPAKLGMYDMLFHTHNEVYETWNVSTGAMIYGGNMVVQGTNSSLKNYYWEIYSIMGDPSLVPYLSIPAQNMAQYPAQILLGQNQINITNVAPYSRIALSFNGVIHGTVFSDDSGSAVLSFEPFTTPGDAKLVITAQKYIPIIEDIQVIPSDGPYITFENVVNNTTGSTFVDFASNSNLSITVNNVGSEPLNNAQVSLTSNTNLVDIVSGNFLIENIPAETVYQITDNFVVGVSSSALDGQVLNLVLTVTSGTHSWAMPVNLIANASSLTTLDFVINDQNGNNNGRLDPGEEVEIVVSFTNNGHAPSLVGNVLLASTNPMVSIETQSITLPSIHHQQSGSMSFNVTIDENTPSGALTSLSYFINLSNQNIQTNYTLPVGLVVEDFESGDFNNLAWQNNSIVPWTIDGNNAFEGQYSARSGAITHNQTSILQVPYTLESTGTISFSLKTSTEQVYDKLQFYVNNSVLGEWSGNTDWTTVEFNIAAGTHTFKWVYRKDAANSQGQDTVWIDEIIFPSSGGGNVNSPIAGLSVDEIDMGQVPVNQVVTARFNIINLGNQNLNGTITMPEGFFLGSGNTFNVLPFANNEYTISFVSAQIGSFSGDIVITTNDTNNTQLVLPVTVYAYITNEDDNVSTPIVTQLKRNYPNPFNPETTISFDLNHNTFVSIQIYNIKGQRVKTLVNDVLNRGNHSVVWNGKDENNRNVSSGVYFYKMTTDNYSAINKMLLVK